MTDPLALPGSWVFGSAVDDGGALAQAKATWFARPDTVIGS